MKKKMMMTSSMHMLIVCFLTGAPNTIQAQKFNVKWNVPWELRKKTEHYQGQSIRVHLDTVVKDQKLHAKVQLHLNGYSDPVNNPYREESRPFVGQLAVFNRDKEYVGRFTSAQPSAVGSLQNRVLTQEHPSATGGFYGKIFTFSNIVYQGNIIRSLPDGDYYLMYVMNKNYITPGRENIPVELARSNFTELHVPFANALESHTLEQAKKDNRGISPWGTKYGLIEMELNVTNKTECTFLASVILHNNTEKSIEVLPFLAIPRAGSTPHYFLNVGTDNGLIEYQGNAPEFPISGYARAATICIPPSGFIGVTHDYSAMSRYLIGQDLNKWKSIQFIARRKFLAEEYFSGRETQNDIFLKSNVVYLNGLE